MVVVVSRAWSRFCQSINHSHHCSPTHFFIVCPIFIFWFCCVQHNQWCGTKTVVCVFFFSHSFLDTCHLFVRFPFFVLVVGKYMCTYMCCCQAFLVRYHTILLVARCSVVSLSWQVSSIQRGWRLQPLAGCACVVVRTYRHDWLCVNQLITHTPHCRCFSITLCKAVYKG